MMDRQTGVRDLPVLYSFRRCPYAMRARLAIHASGTTVELREIVLRDKAPEFLEASVKGTVPVLVACDGSVIDESLDVMLWALRLSDPEGWIATETTDFEAMMQLIEACDTSFKGRLDAYKYASRGAPDAGLAARDEGARFLLELDERLRGSGYLFGARPTLADMAILPFVRQFAHVDRAWFDGEHWSALRRWLDEFLASPRFADVMQKYARWRVGDTPVIFAGGNIR